MFELSLLRIHFTLIFSEAHCLITWLRPSDALRNDKFEVIPGLPPYGCLMTCLSPKGHRLLMHLQFDDLLFIKYVLDLNLAHLCQGHISVSLKIFPIDTVESNPWLDGGLIVVALVGHYDVFVFQNIWIRLSLIIYKDTCSPNGELILACVKGQSVGGIPVAELWARPSYFNYLSHTGLGAVKSEFDCYRGIHFLYLKIICEIKLIKFV